MLTHQSVMNINGDGKEERGLCGIPSPIARFSLGHAARVASFKCDPNRDDWTPRVKPRWAPLFERSEPPDQFSWFCR